MGRLFFMVTQPETSTEATATEQVAPETPDRGPQDDAYFQGLVDATVGDDDEGGAEATVDAASAEAPTPEVALPSAPEPIPTAPVEPAPAVPNETEVLRQQNAAYQQQLQQAAIEQQRQLLEQEVATQASQLEAQGVDPETASQIANQQRQIREQALGAQYQLASQQAYMQGKMNAALHYAGKHSVSAQDLMQYETPQAMEAAAMGQVRVNELEKQVADLRKSGVPAQVMDSNQAAAVPGSSEQKLVDSAINKHWSERTEAEQAAFQRVGGR